MSLAGAAITCYSSFFSRAFLALLNTVFTLCASQSPYSLSSCKEVTHTSTVSSRDISMMLLPPLRLRALVACLGDDRSASAVVGVSRMTAGGAWPSPYCSYQRWILVDIISTLMDGVSDRCQAISTTPQSRHKPRISHVRLPYARGATRRPAC
ncbi:hypothetical protein B0H67DRAFT_585787 [Lasiosphaeris hirsuta]|uniref:Secreted protein n=1 Tax=Lasiosphaeris hirsuta TaxID=260670 RepID=A0AA40A979_9PEZI|nr:hypothetical protein B0H67DRAFT_585787 [Lasiosphaeris hirsuta]